MDHLHRVARMPRGVPENPQLLVLLHGLGSNEQDLMSFAAALDPNLTIVSLRAPNAWNGGFAWFEIGLDSSLITYSESQAMDSLEALLGTLRSLPADLEIPTARPILAGFSQGAMMTLAVSLNHPELVAGAMVLSGAVLPVFAKSPNPHVSAVPHYIQHGIWDPVVPVSAGRNARDILVGLRTPVEYREYPMAHEVSEESLANIVNWIAKT